MVQRRLNAPIGRIGSQQPFWMSQVLSSEWNCRRCHNKQPKLSVAFEMWVKGILAPSSLCRGAGNAAFAMPPQQGLKTYLCLTCAEQLFEETLEKIRVCKELGPEAFRLMEEV